MMLLLVGVLLCCQTLSLALPTRRAEGCPPSSLLQEAISDVRTLRAKGSSDVTPLINMMEAEGNVMTYLERFTEALKSSQENPKRTLAAQLQKIQQEGKSCSGWKELEWEPVEEEDFFYNLDYLLSSLNHSLPEETA